MAQAPPLSDSGDVAQDTGQLKQPPALIFGNCVVAADKVHCFLVSEHIRWRLCSAISRDVTRPVVQTLEKERHRNTHRFPDVPKPGRTYAIGPGLIFLDLLKLDANHISQFLLGHTNEPAPLTDTFSHMSVHDMCHLNSQLSQIHGSLKSLLHRIQTLPK